MKKDGSELPEKLLKWEEILKPGTPFWYISLYSERKQIKCPVCKGKGSVMLEGKEYDCPECYGIGHDWDVEPIRWHVGTLIGRDYCVVTKAEVHQSKKDGYYKVLYWDNCNGFRAENVFTSKAAATKACNKLNKLLEEHKEDLP